MIIEPVGRETSEAPPQVRARNFLKKLRAGFDHVPFGVAAGRLDAFRRNEKPRKAYRDRCVTILRGPAGRACL